jgi:hypothetical protein
MTKKLNEDINKIKSLIDKLNFFKKDTNKIDNKSPKVLRNEKDRFTCTDCGEYDYKMYMVNNDLWNTYGNDRLTLCKSCFEKRIGRELTKDDVSQYRDTLVNLYNPEIINLK